MQGLLARYGQVAGQEGWGHTRAWSPGVRRGSQVQLRTDGRPATTDLLSRMQRHRHTLPLLRELIRGGAPAVSAVRQTGSRGRRPPPETAAAPWSYAGGRHHRREHQSKEVDIPSNRKHRRQVRQCPSSMIARTSRSRDHIRTHVEERPARRHFRRLLNSATDELLRAGVKASVSGVGALALYWWNHHR